MSAYDPTDGYEPCTICSQLTKDPEQVCAACRGTLEKPKRTRRRFTLDRSHKRGNGWKANHIS